MRERPDARGAGSGNQRSGILKETELIVLKVADGVTANGNQPEFTIGYAGSEHLEGVFQTEFEGDVGSANVLLQGRMTSEAPWQTIVTHTGSIGSIVALFPSMRVRILAESGATINCWIGY